MKSASLYALLFAGCIGLSFLFSGMEAGVFALSRWRIRQLMREGRRRATLLYNFLEQSETFLWTILVGNVLAAFGAITLLAAFLYGRFAQHRLAMVLIFLAAVFLFYAFADLLPKMLFRIYPNRLCIAVAAPFRFIDMALAPLVAVIESLSRLLLHWTGGRTFKGQFFNSRNELRLAMQESGQAFTGEERAMINRVLDLPNRRVSEIMLPLNRVPSAHSGMSVREVCQLFREHPRNHLPVWHQDGAARRIAGVVNVKHVMFDFTPDSEAPIADVMRPALFLGADLHIEDALRRMQRTGNRMAILLGHDRHELGVVTLEEILKAIFGEVRL